MNPKENPCPCGTEDSLVTSEKEPIETFPSASHHALTPEQTVFTCYDHTVCEMENQSLIYQSELARTYFCGSELANLHVVHDEMEKLHHFDPEV